MKKKLKNVVIINDSNFISGGEDKVAIQTANMLSNRYNDLNVYFFSNNNIDDTPLSKKVINIRNDITIPIENNNKIQGILNGIYNVKNKRKLSEFLKKLNNEETIIHVHSWSKSITSCIFDVASKLKFKCVLTLHDYFTACPNGGFYNYKKQKICNLKPCSFSCVFCNCDSRNYMFKIYRIIRQYFFNKSIKKLKYAISISDFSEKILKKYLNPNLSITKIRNPLDFSLANEKISPSKNEYYLYVGRISKEKGVDIFCEAISKLNLRGIVVGDGSERLKLEKKYKTIEFVGWKKSEDVKKYMRNARALIFPSRWYEGSPLTTIEAMSQGLPCISSSCNAAIDDLVFDNGLIFKNFNDLIEKIKICEDDEKLEKLSINSYKYVKNLLNKNSYCEEIYDYYNKILGEK